MRARLFGGLPALMLLVVGSSCSGSGNPAPGTEATWSLASDALTATSTSFVAEVVRLACSGGSTGAVGAPVIEHRADTIVVTFKAAPLDKDVAYGCPGNDRVAVRVDLGEVIGNRQLIDGGCRAYALARDISACAAGGLRWAP